MRKGNFHPNLKILKVNIRLNVLKRIIHMLRKPMLLLLEVEKNLDMPMMTQKPKELDSKDIDLPNIDEIVKRPFAIPFPQALKSSRKLDSSLEILENHRQVKINLPLLHVIKQIPSYAKVIKDLCIMKRKHNVKKTAFLME